MAVGHGTRLLSQPGWGEGERGWSCYSRAGASATASTDHELAGVCAAVCVRAALRGIDDGLCQKACGLLARRSIISKARAFAHKSQAGYRQRGS